MLQVLNHVWVVTRGGIIPKMLHPNVTRGAANVASVRRLRNLVHGAIALKSLRALKVRHDGQLSASPHLPAVICSEECPRGTRSWSVLSSLSALKMRHLSMIPVGHCLSCKHGQNQAM